jgi:hypothetical protein
VQSGFRRPDGNIQAIRHLGQGEPEVVVEDEHGALLVRKPPEAPFELIAVVDRQQFVGSW